MNVPLALGKLGSVMWGLNFSPLTICPEMYSFCLSTYFMIQGDDYAEYETVMCSLQASTECDYHYFVPLNSLGSSVYVVEPNKCLPLPVWAIFIIILMALIIIGVVILALTKVLLMYLDYRELKGFKYELMNAEFTKFRNPVYQKPTVTYKNVIYGIEDLGDKPEETLS